MTDSQNFQKQYHTTSHVGIVPFSSNCLLDGPTMTPIAPFGTSHLCVTMSQIDTSYLDKWKLTRLDSPVARYTLSNPFN